MAGYTDIQRREIFHFLFLEELLRISDPKLYVLKGGVNLRFFFRSLRYSEDMDIDVLAGNVTTLKKNGYKILQSASLLRSLKAYGISDLTINDPAKAKHTETTQRFRLNLITTAGESLPTKVEFSRRSNDKLPYALEKLDPQIAKSYQRLAYRCQHYTGESAVLQKVNALAGRDTPQARDVFDLDVLQAGGHVKKGGIKATISKKVREAALENLQTLSYDDFRGQVLEFLNEEIRERYDGEGSWEAMKLSIREVVLDEK